ncbi:diaminopimelate epimerase [bacterium]|nr:diaminopimelate epimerase [bacterium]
MGAMHFAKMSGAGNDFIVLDNRQGDVKDVGSEFIRRVCARGLSVGADGLLILSRSEKVDFEMRYFNADGSEAAMCGNGARCIARFAVLLGMKPEGEQVVFQTQAGIYQATVNGIQVDLKMIPPTEVKQDIEVVLPDQVRRCDFADTGVPHAVFFSDSVENEDVDQTGRTVRYHDVFRPDGANVNFCHVIDRHALAFRIYERGVEAETLASGTGAAACVLTAAHRGWVESPVKVKTHSGIELEMRFEKTGDKFHEVFQRGEARLIYWGELTPEAAMI